MVRQESRGDTVPAGEFFAFDNDRDIVVMLPSVRTEREPNLVCENYPRYRYAVSPDDVLSAVRVFGLLTSCYPKRVWVSFSRECEGKKPPDANLVLIGGPPTQTIARGALSNLPIRFGPDDENRQIVGILGDYAIEHSAPTTSLRGPIVRDYCLISKFPRNTTTWFVISGLRAFGQEASYHFLNDPHFYESVREVSSKESFQVLVRIPVGEGMDHQWEIVEMIPRVRRPTVFLAYGGEDAEAARGLAEKIRCRGVDVEMAPESLSEPARWRRQIGDLIRRSDVFLPCYSKRTVARLADRSDGIVMRDEIEQAADERQRREKEGAKLSIVPVRLEECEPSDRFGHGVHDVPISISDWDYADFFGDEDAVARGLSRILERVWGLVRP